MATLKGLTKNVGEYVWITPYADIEEFPTYRDEGGAEVVLSEQWREIGFRVKYPSMKIINNLSIRSFRSYAVRGTSEMRKEFDPERLADFIAKEIIKEWENVEGEGGSSAPYDPAFMKAEFMKSQFLLNEFITHYQSVGESAASDAEVASEDFL